MPLPMFLTRALALFRDPGIGLVQTPQHFINPDPIQTNLAAADVWPDEQRFFFDISQPSKDAWDLAFCCGTSSVIRFEPLLGLGGFPTDSVTEDYLVTLRLKEQGLKTAYLNEPLTLGLAPEGLKEYITQRGRWCLGFMQIVRGPSGPFSSRTSLKLIDRIALIESFLGWTGPYFANVMGLLVPILYLLFGIRAVEADGTDVLLFFLPFYLWHAATMYWISGGRSLMVMTSVAQFIVTPAILKAVIVGLCRPQGHKFKVTAKGGDRGTRFVEWPILRLFGGMLILTFAGLLYAFILHVRGDILALGGPAFAWSWYNIVVLTLVCLVCVEQPRRRKAERFLTDEAIMMTIDGRTSVHRLVEISITGAQIRGAIDHPIGTVVACTIKGHAVSATIVRKLRESFAVIFDESTPARIAMVRNFYASNYVGVMDEVYAPDVGAAIVKRFFE